MLQWLYACAIQSEGKPAVQIIQSMEKVVKMVWELQLRQSRERRECAFLVAVAVFSSQFRPKHEN